MRNGLPRRARCCCAAGSNGCVRSAGSSAPRIDAVIMRTIIAIVGLVPVAAAGALRTRLQPVARRSALLPQQVGRMPAALRTALLPFWLLHKLLLWLLRRCFGLSLKLLLLRRIHSLTKRPGVKTYACACARERAGEHACSQGRSSSGFRGIGAAATSAPAPAPRPKTRVTAARTASARKATLGAAQLRRYTCGCLHALACTTHDSARTGCAL
mmetsp:Transcript_17607/g.52902  ORF Transcript_17607/g.52902 Transcript_17607/m.52902 type:complete len:213 (+) Transcript_17607:1005-1643(+)